MVTIKEWHVDSAWQEPFVAELRRRGADPMAVNHALQHVDATCAASGKSPQEVFGDPRGYAEVVPLRPRKTVSRSRQIAIGVALLGLIGMFLALWGWSGIQRDVDSLLGMSPWIPFVVGVLLTLGAASFDLAMGVRSDVYAFEPGEKPTAFQLFVNKLAPWVIVLLTALGVLLIWLQNR